MCFYFERINISLIWLDWWYGYSISNNLSNHNSCDLKHQNHNLLICGIKIPPVIFDQKFKILFKNMMLTKSRAVALAVLSRVRPVGVNNRTLKKWSLGTRWRHGCQGPPFNRLQSAAQSGPILDAGWILCTPTCRFSWSPVCFLVNYFNYISAPWLQWINHLNCSHRGFETVTYMLEGSFKHEDFAGHRGTINAGDLQWMTAGKVIWYH